VKAPYTKENPHETIIAFALYTVLAVAASTALVAQQPAVKANIPFDFTVGDQSMPAGGYTFSSPGRNIVQIQSTDRKHVGLVASSASSMNRRPALCWSLTSMVSTTS